MFGFIRLVLILLVGLTVIYGARCSTRARCGGRS